MLSIDTLKAAPKGSRWGADYFPNHPVVSHNGETFRFYEDLIKDKLVVVNFIYTYCPDICPLSTSRMAEVQKKLGDIIGRDIFMYSITLDPERDTPQKLKAYAEAFDVKPGWLFLTGDPKQLRDIRRKLGDRSRKLSEHRSDVWLGNDTDGRWFRDSSLSNLDRLANTIRSLDPKWRALARERVKLVVRKKPRAYYKTGTIPGHNLFMKLCATCHTIGKGKRVGPDLKGVAERRNRDWLISMISAPETLRAKKDPILAKLEKQYPGVWMPNLSLSEIDASDLIAYINMITKAAGSPAQASKQDGLAPSATADGAKTLDQ